MKRPVDMWTDEPLPVDIAPPTPRPEPVLPASAREKRAKPEYRRLHLVKPHQCDDCLLVSSQQYPNDPVPLKAKWERRVRGEGARYLCGPHADQWKAKDDPNGKGLDP